MPVIGRTSSGKYQAVILMGLSSSGKRVIKHVTRNTLEECKKVAWKIEQERDWGLVNGQH